MKIKRTFWVFCILTIGVCFIFSCSKEEKIKYPYTEIEFINLGVKSGLTSNSSEQAFREGLNEVMLTWAANNPSSGDVVIGGVTYELTNIQDIGGAVPKFIWELFWKELDKYSYSIGSCWGFSHCEIPAKRKEGTGYVLYTIVTQNYGNPEVLYLAIKCKVTPKKSKAKSGDNFEYEESQNVLEHIKSSESKIYRREHIQNY
jgi:hypothetical protein